MKIRFHNKRFYHVFAALFAVLLLAAEIGLTNLNSIWKIGEAVILLVLFYVHALVFVPSLLKTKKINKYMLLTFALYATGAVLLAILSVAARSDYIYVFTIILENGLDTSDNLLRLYAYKYFLSLTVFCFSLAYGYFISDTKDKLSYIGTLVFRMKSTEVLLHLVLLVILFIASYFLNFFFNEIMVACLLLFYFHLLVVSNFLFRNKNLKLFVTLVITELVLFSVAIVHVSQLSAGLVISIYVTVITFATIYAFVKNKFREQQTLFSQKHAELETLKAQINPHFLFNSLNTLYSFAIKENAEKTADNIKKFSNLIRFTISDLGQDFIPLNNEIGYIKDYIEIQLDRCPVQPKITLNIHNCDRAQIAPMILIPFVENAFKHGINPIEESVLSIDLRCDGRTIYFECRNSVKQKLKSGLKEEGFGIGVNNVKSRLNLIYPEKHFLSIEEQKNYYTVNLEIYDYCNSH